MLEKAKKKGSALEYPVSGCSQVGGKLTIERHVLWKHTARENITFSCSVCDFVSVKESDIKKHHKWYKPHTESKAPVFDVVRGKGTYTTVNQL